MAVNKLYPVDENTGRAYKVEDVSAEYGEGAWKYSDGSIRGKAGRMITKIESGYEITPANARELQARRWQLAQERTASWIVKEAMSIDPNVRDEYDAHALMMSKQYTTIIDSDKPRMDDAEKLAQLMGTAPRSAEIRRESAPNDVNSDLSSALAQLVEFMSGRSRKTIDGEVIDIRSDSEDEVE